MQAKATTLLVLLTFLGMVGLYIGLYLAYQKYQQYAPTLQKLSDDVSSIEGSSTVSSITGVVSSILGSK